MASFYDQLTNTYRDTAYALDSASLEADNTSIFDSAANIVTKGAPLTALAIISSFANTGIKVANFFGAEMDEINTRQIALDYFGDSTAKYYDENSGAIEFSALAIGSFVPGMAALKLLKLAQATGESGLLLGRALGVFTSNRSKLVANAQKVLAEGENAMFPSLSSDTLKAIGLGFGEQALQGIVWETATVATMQANPILSQMDLTDTIQNIMVGGLVNSVIGGGLGALSTLKEFRNIRQAAVLDTNKFEKITRLGGKEGTFNAGDRVALMLDDMISVPEPNSTLARARAASAETNARMDAMKHLQSIVPGNEESVANTFFTSVYDAIKSGKATMADGYDLLARLAKLSRPVDDEIANATGTVPTGEMFYVNRFSRRGVAEINFEDMVSASPHADAELSQLYRLNKPGDKPVIGSFQDTITLPSGEAVPRYKNATEAFAQNPDLDVFIDARFRVGVNPDSQRITRVAREGESRILTNKEEITYRKTGKLPEGTTRGLTGAPLIFNRVTGAITSGDGLVPTVGDLGVPTLINDGLLVNGRLFPQTLDSVVTAETSSLDANARYVWAAERKIRGGDAIRTDDIAMLEQLHREMSAHKSNISNRNPEADYADMKTRAGVVLKDPETGETFSLPRSVADLEAQIMEAKQNLSAELLSADTNISVQDLMRRVNAPESYFENGLRAQSYNEAHIPLHENASQTNFKLEYDLNNWQRLDDGMVARGAIDVQYRINVIKQAAEAALAAFAKGEAEAFTIKASSQEIGLEGAGASFFGFANAAYGTVKQQFERVGRAVDQWTQRTNQAHVEKLAPAVQALRLNPQATAEINMFTFVRQTTGEHFTFLPADLAKQYKLSADTAVLAQSLVRDKAGRIIGWNRNYVPEGFIHPNAADAFTVPAGQVDRNALRTFYELSPDAAAFERANLDINNYRTVNRNNWWTALGMEPKLQPDILYAPPIDTGKYSFFAMVRQREGQGWADNSTAVVVAKSAKELEQKLALIDDAQFEKFTKDQIKKFHEVQGDYDYNRNFAQNTVNSELRRRGVLNDLVPDIGVDSLIRNTIDYHSKQNLRLVRDYVELGNSQLFAELRALGQRYTGVETSKVGFLPSVFGRTAQNPYNDMMKTALAISPKENYRMWADANDKLESMFSTAFATAKNAFVAAKEGHIPFEEANIMANRMGIGNVYSSMTDAASSYESLARMLPPQRYLSKFVATANSVMAATAIRLDAFQALINAVATPVLLLAEAHSASKAVQQLLTTELPGTGKQIPAISKLMFQATASFVRNDGERQALTPLLKQIGAIKDNIGEYYRLVDEMTLPYGKLSEGQWVERAGKMVELGAKFTGNNLAEEFSRYVPGYVAYKIFSAAGIEGQALRDNIATFVNRVQGNYTAAQRPVAFQGPVGQAIGLFQTYQVNLLQQMLRYAADGEAKTLAILAGAQATLFGINGLPGFQAINQHLIGAAPGNPSHADFYSSLTSPGIGSMNPLQRSVGDYMLYGTLSNVLHTGLYSRGDISPRNITILPLNPLDFPAVSGSIKLVSSLIDVGRSIANGGNVPTSLLLGLEHNGLSRPLSGLAQLAQGYVTTGQGGIIATTRPGMANNEMGFADLASVSNFSRLLGARPFDEAVVLDTLYRSKLYKAKDLTRITELGEAFKTQAYGGNVDPAVVNEFAARYAAAGGNVTSFGKSIIAWTNAANVSTANQIYRQLQTPENQNYIRAMGGVKLPDFSMYNPNIAASVSAVAPVE